MVGIFAAAAPVGALFVVQDAIDKGMRDHDRARLERDVLVYLGINAAAWVLQTTLVRGLARVGQDLVLALRRDLFDHLTTLSLRYFGGQKAGWIIARLTSDVDALSDVLSQGLTTLVVNTLTLVAAVCGLFILDWRLGGVALVILPPGDRPHAHVPGEVARGLPARARDDRRPDRADRRVGVRAWP